MNELEKICASLPVTELLAQLAEEAAELGHAALKLRRALGDKNPTPVTPGKAQAALLEEIADVYTAVDVVAYVLKLDAAEATRICNEKRARWAERLERVENGEK